VKALALASVAAMPMMAAPSSAFAAEQKFECDGNFIVAVGADNSYANVFDNTGFKRLTGAGDARWERSDDAMSLTRDGDALTLVVGETTANCTAMIEEAATEKAPVAAPAAQEAEVAEAAPTTTPTPTPTPATETAEATPETLPQADAVVDATVTATTPAGGTIQPSSGTGAEAPAAVQPLLETPASSLADAALSQTAPVIAVEPQAEPAATEVAALETPAQNEDIAGVESLITGKSRGGRLRAGPGTDFSSPGSILKDTPVTILQNAGNTFRGYDWFEIQFEDGRTAYTWGGILCTDAEKIDGVFEICG
ncbi:MAG: SH3 domain-containing protein, partial [Pseudomonadota bacterium]